MKEKIGYWNNATSTIDWCEINYEITYYIVEFWNTISNLTMILLPSYGLYWSFRQNSSRQFNRYRVPKSVLACFVALIIVGSGSWLFHMTLSYSMQLLDELPMIFGSGVALFALIDLFLTVNEFDCELKGTTPLKRKTFLKKRIFQRTNLGILIGVYCLLVTYAYCYIWTNPVFHEIAFGLVIMIALIIYLVSYWKYSRAYKIPNRLVFLIIFYGILAFIFWNIDNRFCEYLREYRDSVEEFLGLKSDWKLNDFKLKPILFNVLSIWLKSLSEFHSWWHVFTSYAAFLCILFLIEMSYEHHLRLVKIIDHQRPPIGSKCCDMYYFFTVENENKCNCLAVKNIKSK
jgi:dihydroceramidase